MRIEFLTPTEGHLSPNYLARNVSVHANGNRFTVKDDIREGLVAASCSDNGSLSRFGRTGRHGQGNSNLASFLVKLNFHCFLSSLGVYALFVLVVVVPLLCAALLGPIVKLLIGELGGIEHGVELCRASVAEAEIGDGLGEGQDLTTGFALLLNHGHIIPRGRGLVKPKPRKVRKWFEPGG